MYEYIEGEFVEKSPAHLIVQAGHMAYYIHISVFTYSQVSSQSSGRIYLHFVVREDAQILYGFGGREEREIFRMLISVSGVGANTSRLILSSLSPDEISQAILAGNVSILQGIKGIGAKSAQRIIIDLKDKLGKGAGIDELFFSQDNTSRDEALSALVALGFPKKTIEKTVTRILSEQPELSVEEVVKAALKFM
ncbi:MAG: Holliday junction branch migration protein RuvA [Bacteroidetes bacterium]|nr:MAG: Holliday junction branch migration protein RuvA [Bacteroidota bacterium]RLD95970.1 MAG: Holliday junction branch migration protein RuvA [Bacteroidota bacterium]